VDDDPLPLRVLELRRQIAELSGTIQQLRRSGLDNAAPRLLISRKRAEFEDLSRQTKSRSSLEGYCYHHVQAIIVAIDQCAEAALGSRKYFLNRPLRAG